MKVLLLTGFIPSRGGGGVERHVFDLAAGLIKRGVDVTVVCENQEHFPGDYQEIKDRLVLRNIRYRDLFGWIKGPRRLKTLAGALDYSLRLLKRSRELSKAINPADYDVVHSHAQVGGLALLKLRLRHGKKPAAVTTLHGTAAGFYDSFRRHRLGMRLPPPEMATSMLLELLSVRLSDACLAVSENVGRNARDFYGVPQHKVNVIYNWADRAKFQRVDRARAREQLGLDQGQKYLLFVGRTDPMKGFRMLLEAMDYIGDAATLLVISGAESDRGKSHGNVRYLGFANEELPAYYSACDLFVFPSLYEGLPLTLIEAVSCGCVPVCMRKPPMGEVVDDSMGFYCDKFDPRAYAEVVQNALKSPDLGAMSASCTAGARKFDMDRSIDHTLDLYRRLLEK